MRHRERRPPPLLLLLRLRPSCLRAFLQHRFLHYQPRGTRPKKRFARGIGDSVDNNAGAEPASGTSAGSSGGVRSPLSLCPPSTTYGHAGRIRLWEIAVIAALTFVAVAIRMQNLETVPPGVANDEAELALEALRISQGEIWPGAWTGVHAGHTRRARPLAGAAPALPGTQASLQPGGAPWLPGVALIPVAYLLMRQLFSARTAILTAAFLTFHVWVLVFSPHRIPGDARRLLLCGQASGCSSQASARTVGGPPGSEASCFGLGWYTYKSFPVYALAVWGVLILFLLLRPETATQGGLLVPRRFRCGQRAHDLLLPHVGRRRGVRYACTRGTAPLARAPS